MACFRFMIDNYANTDLLANYFVSSEQAAFPVLNAFNGLRRSKVWRSNGYWKIEAGSNTIIFNEGGSDLTATIAPNEYNSTADLLAAIDTAFTTAPGAAGSYTVTQNSQLKFVITKTTGTFVIKWTNPSSEDMADILGFDTGADDTGSLTYTSDVLKINYPNEYIMLDMGISSNPDSFCLIGPRNRPLKLSPSGVFKVEGNETNNFTNPSFSETLTYDDEVLSLHRDGGLHTQPLRYWRISFQDQNPLGYVEVGAFFLGESYNPTYGKPQFPFNGQYVDRTENIFSEGGQSFSDIFPQTERFQVQWSFLRKDEKEKFQELYRMVGKGTPFFVSFDPNEAFSTTEARNIRYVKFESEPTYELATPNNFRSAMVFLEQL